MPGAVVPESVPVPPESTSPPPESVAVSREPVLVSVEPDIVSPSLPERFRQRLFMHQDGLLLTLFVTALEERGFFVHPGRGASSIRELVMRTGALPRITSGPQATTDGHSLHWTLGDHVKCRA